MPAAARSSASNYALSYITGTLTVSPATLTVSGITANTKSYDGTTTATLNTDSATLSERGQRRYRVPGRQQLHRHVCLGQCRHRHHMSTVSGLALGGADAADYTLTQPTGLTPTSPRRR